ncbi:hypothetical protein ACLOAU_18410 [Niabella sp. CJ426]|uniref:hypothetical protein n=1 Tax=Niabella sp. CJ426 TaxID=3393740 RepID=UPI003CFF2140
MRILRTGICFLVVAVTLLLSCKKNEYTEFDKDALNKILEYSIENVPQSIKAAISQTENTITVYIPYYIGVDFLVAKIKLDEGAQLLDSLDNPIDLREESEPVPVGASVKYKVKSSDGVERVYTLVQEVLPFSEPLTVTYKDKLGTDSFLTKTVHTRFEVLGNFESVSKSAKVILKNRTTGVEYDNFMTVNSVETGNASYTMTLNILPDALAGEYDARLVHQGRTGKLPPIRLFYNVGTPGFWLSTTNYAAGDTMVFNAIGYTPAAYDGVFVGLERMYLKLDTAYIWNKPAAFTADYHNKKIEMKIVSWNRTQVKAIFPDIPVGQYSTSYQWGSFFPNIKYCGLGFYFDFNSETNWGKDVLLSAASSTFLVNPKVK